jgi:hypothetical protein
LKTLPIFKVTNFLYNDNNISRSNNESLFLSIGEKRLGNRSSSFRWIPKRMLKSGKKERKKPSRHRRRKK